jgi:hypothetical protein
MNLEDRISNLSVTTNSELDSLASRIIVEAANGNILAAQTLVASIPTVAGFNESVKRVQSQMQSLASEVSRLESMRNSTVSSASPNASQVSVTPSGLRDDELFLLNTPYYAYLFSRLFKAGCSRMGLINDFNKWARSNKATINGSVLNGLEWASRTMSGKGWLTKNGEGYWQLTESGKEVARRFAQHKR